MHGFGKGLEITDSARRPWLPPVESFKRRICAGIGELPCSWRRLDGPARCAKVAAQKSRFQKVQKGQLLQGVSHVLASVWLCLGVVALAALTHRGFRQSFRQAEHPGAAGADVRIDKIKDTDYAPAFEEAMKQQIAEIDAVSPTARPSRPSRTPSSPWKLPGRMLDRVTRPPSSAVVQANTNPTLDKIAVRRGAEACRSGDNGRHLPERQALRPREGPSADARDTAKLDPESAQAAEDLLSPSSSMPAPISPMPTSRSCATSTRKTRRWRPISSRS